ncbi:hypothetical protein ACFFP0_07155 [Rhizobium puerariae]|uniref:Uncharacterized protein n=1 Tax=Rhizobium puerariae TaxID=1585791 RepID=A0ABV6ADJ3_9HYPH
MVGGGFSLFGFDLFGLSRRDPSRTGERTAEHQASERAKDDHDGQRLADREYSESFFWGMYPIY